MAYADQQMSGNRIIAIILVALIHVAVGYALVTGLAVSAYKKIVERVTTVDIEEEEPEEEPPPPPPDEIVPPPIVAPPPPISFTPPAYNPPTVPEPPPPAPPIPRAAPPPPAPPPPSQARGVQRDNFGRWQSQIVNEGYPPRAVRDEIEGRVGVAVVVGENGRVTSCSVTSPSGESVLDDAACRAMQRYARYKPALDAAGNPTAGRDNLTIVYQLN